MSLQPEVLLCVCLVAAVQSIFGVGVLLFGTPVLLMLGHGFAPVLAVLLPVSVCISLSQVAAAPARVQWRFVRRALACSAPAIALALWAALAVGARLGIVVAALLLLQAAKGLSPRLQALWARLAAYERSWLVATGWVHGFTNLGGSMLSVVVHQKGWPKAGARATIAACYLGFAALQLAVLVAREGAVFVFAAGAHGAYVATGFGVYALVMRTLDRRLDESAYARAFSGFLLACGLLIGLRSI